MPHIVENHILIPRIAELLKEGRSVDFTPTGNSMRPFIEGGKDTVTLRLKKEVKPGDICLAELPPREGSDIPVFVLHRVIRVDNDKVTLQGDGNLRGTECCGRKDVLGTVEMIIKPDGRQVKPSSGRGWRYLCRPRWFWLKLYRHVCVYKTLMPLSWKQKNK